MSAKRSKPLTNYLKKLYDNPALVNRYRQDFEGALRDSGLSDSLRKVLRSKNLKNVVHAMVDEHVPAKSLGNKAKRPALALFIVWPIAVAPMAKGTSQKAQS